MRREMYLYIPTAKIPVEYMKKKIEIYRGSFRDFHDVSKDQCICWKHFLTVTRPCSSYESGLVSIYKTSKKGVYVVKTYYDGCFHPFIGYTHLTEEIIKDIEAVRVFVNPRNK